MVDFKGPDSLVHGPGWETLNPGYWQIKDNSLRRRIGNYGDRARSTGFPFHYETHRRNGGVMRWTTTRRYRMASFTGRDWQLAGSWTIRARFKYHGNVDVRREGDDDSWKMYRPGYAMMGLALGAKNLFESYNKVRNAQSLHGPTMVSSVSQGSLEKAKQGGRASRLVDAPELKAGDVVEIELAARPVDGSTVELVAKFTGPDGNTTTVTQTAKRRSAEGYVGIVGRGLADFSVERFEVEPSKNRQLEVGEVDCYTCYPLGDTLKEANGAWQVRFVALFATDGQRAELRIADSPNPVGGWQQQPVLAPLK